MEEKKKRKTYGEEGKIRGGRDGGKIGGKIMRWREKRGLDWRGGENGRKGGMEGGK